MSDTDDRGFNEDRERQRRFLKEAHGLSDDDIEEILDLFMEYRESAEDHLEEDDFEEEVLQEFENEEQGDLKLVGQDGPLDIYEIDDRKMVPYDQVYEVVERFNQHLERSIEDQDEMIDRISELNSEKPESRISEEAKQAIDNIYERTRDT